jgi:hypothetical protein
MKIQEINNKIAEVIENATRENRRLRAKEPEVTRRAREASQTADHYEDVVKALEEMG